MFRDLGTLSATAIFACIPFLGSWLAPIGPPARAQSLKAPSEYAAGESLKALEGELEAIQSKLRALDYARSARTSRGGGPDERGARIVNGVGTINYPASGALLSGKDSRTAIAWCTGTLIRPDRFLTAAHCIAENPFPQNYHVYLQSAGFFKVMAIDWQKNEYSFPRADVAVLTLETPVPRIQPEEFNRFSPTALGTLGTIVGFGRTGGLNQDYGIKREGYIQTGSCSGQYAGVPLVCWGYQAETVGGQLRSNTCNADSGGPLFTMLSVADKSVRAIAGVTSGGRQNDCLVGDRSYDADVHHYSNWIESVAGSTGSAPGGPAVDIERDVVGDSFGLGPERTEVVIPFDVSSGIGRLMVAMNGDDNGQGQNDFDLYVMQSNTRIEEAPCKEDGAGQFAFCSFDNPAAGPWRVVLRAKRGRGLAQVVVTRLPKSTP